MFAEFPESLAPRLWQGLMAQGIESLYSHQAEAFRRAQEGRNIVIVTPTVSGKTLCYNLPVLSSLLATREWDITGDHRVIAEYRFRMRLPRSREGYLFA